jgi:hypothetical protein
MKFSELLGEPEPERERDLPEEAEPISVFAPVPVAAPPATTSVAYPTAPPEPVAPRPTVAPIPTTPAPPAPRTPPEGPATPRSGLAEVNVRQEAPPPLVEEPEIDALVHLEAVVDDLLPSTSRRGRK